MKIFGLGNGDQGILLIKLTNQAMIVPPRSSNLGIDSFCIVVILVLDAIILDSIRYSSNSDQR